MNEFNLFILNQNENIKVFLPKRQVVSREDWRQLIWLSVKAVAFELERVLGSEEEAQFVR